MTPTLRDCLKIHSPIGKVILAYLDKALEEREVWAAHLAGLQAEATDKLQLEPDRLLVLLG